MAKGLDHASQLWLRPFPLPSCYETDDSRHRLSLADPAPLSLTSSTTGCRKAILEVAIARYFDTPQQPELSINNFRVSLRQWTFQNSIGLFGNLDCRPSGRSRYVSFPGSEARRYIVALARFSSRKKAPGNIRFTSWWSCSRKASLPIFVNGT